MNQYSHFMPMVAKVALNIAKDIEFDYAIGPDMAIFAGSRVLVPFGSRKAVGIVTALVQDSPYQKLKTILCVLDSVPLFSDEDIIFARKLREKYPYPLGEFLSMMLPAHLKKAIVYDVERPASYVEGFTQEFYRADSFAARYASWKNRVKDSLARGQSVIICFPVLAYLQEAMVHIAKDFPDAVVITSTSKEGQAFSNWQRTRKNALIVCTRMGIFLYPQDLGLVVVEDENNHSYFQEEKPFYHLLDVARILCQHKQVPLILSADLPSLATYRQIKEGHVLLHDTPYAGHVETVALSAHHKGVVTSPILFELLRDSFKNNRHSAVIWNKKGYATVIKCNICGHVYRCQRCSSALKIFSGNDQGVCPQCNKQYALPKVCEVCHKGYLKLSGLGIERVETMLRKNFPAVTMSAAGSKNEQTAHIVFHTAGIISTLYGDRHYDEGFLLDADALLWHSDFKSSFNAYAYIKKIALLFKRELYVFTSHSDHYLFKTLSGDWKDFYEKELEFRRQVNLPPYGVVVRLVLRGPAESTLLQGAELVYNDLCARGLEAYGPFKEQPFKLRGNYRYAIVIKGADAAVQAQVSLAAEALRSRVIKRSIIVD